MSTTHSILPGISKLIAATNDRVRSAAANDNPVLLTGELGTEKAFAAKLIHQLSKRAPKPLSKISVSWKLPPDLSQHFQQCDGGSLIIHLQKECPVDMQYTLVEMTSDGAFADPMSGDVIESDVRIILMSSMELDTLSSRTMLLPELRDILMSQHIEIPPLRERLEDIPALVRYAIKRANDTGRSPAKTVDPRVLSLFRQWDWPGNSEDLLLVTAQAAIACKSEAVEIDDLPENFLSQMSQESIAAARAVRVTSKPSPTKSHDRRAEVSTNHDAEEVTLHQDDDGKTALDLEVHPPAPSRPVAPQTQPEVPLLAPPEHVTNRVLALGRRLHAQSLLLKKQMSGPLERDGSRASLDQLMGSVTEQEALAALELELDRGLDMVHGLRRQMALLNMRQQQSAETIRDLVNRITLLTSGTAAEKSEASREARELADSLRVVDEIFQRVSTELPTFGLHVEQSFSASPARRESRS